MTEAEWLAGEDPRPMLELVRERGSERRLRLFLCAGCRYTWPFLDQQFSGRAVEIAERYADGLASDDALWPAHSSAEIPTFGIERRQSTEFRSRKSLPQSVRKLIAMGELSEDDLLAPEGVAEKEEAARAEQERARSAAAELAYRCSSLGPLAEVLRLTPDGFDSPTLLTDAGWPGWLLRDLFGNPFRPVSLNPAWRTPDVVAIAQAAYDERIAPDPANPGWLTIDPTRLAILADALLDAGCEDEVILSHCRSERPHVRGCWLIDLLLGKE